MISYLTDMDGVDDEDVRLLCHTEHCPAFLSLVRPILGVELRTVLCPELAIATGALWKIPQFAARSKENPPQSVT